MNETLEIESPQVFYQEVEELVWDLDISYIDAVIVYCEKRGLETETVSSLILKNPNLKSKIAMEAEDLNLIEKSARLPI